MSDGEQLYRSRERLKHAVNVYWNILKIQWLHGATRRWRKEEAVHVSCAHPGIIDGDV